MYICITIINKTKNIKLCTHLKTLYKIAIKTKKIIYGTRTEMFHIIESNDRDFNTNYASTKDVSDKLGEVKTVLKSIGRL